MVGEKKELNHSVGKGVSMDVRNRVKKKKLKGLKGNIMCDVILDWQLGADSVSQLCVR